MDGLEIRRLGPADAVRIADCFHRVYGKSYANDQFYDKHKLAVLMEEGRLHSVGAVAADGRVVGHMAMTRHPDATSAELGNTVVDPAARGAGVAWKVGAELTAWCSELGYRGYLHYPTTDHHIMQRESVKRGFETGLMLGYIPAETDGKVGGGDHHLRQASTIVYQPLGQPQAQRYYLPTYCGELVEEFAAAAGVERQWLSSAPGGLPSTTFASALLHEKRDLNRLSIAAVGADVLDRIATHEDVPAACRQIDFLLSDAGTEWGVAAALDAGYWFCGWLPGFATADVFRLQKVDTLQTIMRPELVNPVAQSLLNLAP